MTNGDDHQPDHGVEPSNDLAAWIDKEVLRAEAEYDVVRSRAINVVSLSGVLITLLGGFVTLATKVRPGLLTGSAGTSVVIAMLSFAVGAAVAVVVNMPQHVERSEPDKLLGFVVDSWNAVGWQQSIAKAQAVYLGSLAAANGRKAWLLLASLSLVVIGMLSTGLATVIVVHRL
jgi:hypothetical protein